MNSQLVTVFGPVLSLPHPLQPPTFSRLRTIKERGKFSQHWTLIEISLMSFRSLVILGFCLVLVNCMSASEHQRSLHSAQERDLTVGLVQAKITKGMSGAEVSEVLGSPNIVTKDDLGGEAWIYDKIATEASYSTDRGGAGGVAGAGGTPGSSLILGGLGGSYSKSAGASATTQRTLTVVIKFDQRARVRDFSYHSSKF